MNITAKIEVQEVKLTTYSEEVLARPVMSSGPNDPNNSFSSATPSGEIKLSITNKAAWGAFRPGKKYFVMFEEELTPISQ